MNNEEQANRLEQAVAVFKLTGAMNTAQQLHEATTPRANPANAAPRPMHSASRRPVHQAAAKEEWEEF
ncbi:hypothetical protein [Halomonas sp. 25-S5]|uniref:hypothetical protein n=1 Tax=Halomonas sp. 25-S5 TaxID=2994065 RepID=UPI0024698C76|nr:hypothetical protein [Halomonas sp. 25-S5]